MHTCICTSGDCLFLSNKSGTLQYCSSRFMIACFKPEFSSHVQIVYSHRDCILMLQVQPQSWVFVSTSITLIHCLTSQSLGKTNLFPSQELVALKETIFSLCLIPFSAMLLFTLAFSQLTILTETVHWISGVFAGNSNNIVKMRPNSNVVSSAHWSRLTAHKFA